MDGSGGSTVRSRLGSRGSPANEPSTSRREDYADPLWDTPTLVRSSSPVQPLRWRVDTIVPTQGGLATTSTRKGDGMPTFVGINSAAHAGKSSQTHDMRNMPAGLTPTMPEPSQGIRSLSTLMATTAGLKAGGLSTSSGGLVSMSTTGRHDGLAGFEGCLSSAHAGWSSHASIQAAGGSLGDPTPPVPGGVRQVEPSTKGSMVQGTAGLTSSSTRGTDGLLPFGNTPHAPRGRNNDIGNGPGGLGSLTPAPEKKGLGHGACRPVAVPCGQGPLKWSPSTSGPRLRQEMPMGKRVWGGELGAQADHLIASLAGLHVTGPAPPEGRSHALAGAQLRSSWQGAAGTLVHTQAIQQGDVIYLQLAPQPRSGGKQTHYPKGRSECITHADTGLTPVALRRPHRPYAGLTSGSSLVSTEWGVMGREGAVIRARTPSNARREAREAINGTCLLASKGGVTPDLPPTREATIRRNTSGMYASVYDVDHAVAAAAPRAPSLRYAGGALLSSSHDSALWRTAASAAGSSASLARPAPGGGASGRQSPPPLTAPFASGNGWGFDD